MQSRGRISTLGLRFVLAVGELSRGWPHAGGLSITLMVGLGTMYSTWYMVHSTTRDVPSPPLK